ncbi:MAG: Spx/MgsR family RNA polymerase-binding regulatory protein [Sandaracinaceae bacterium]|nr:Spx/MgsR family RNA polymerase-binding regulatory protein [Sandaracinaceae bacterium]
MSGLIVYHYPGCSTCKRARKWLEARGHTPRLVDLVATPPSQAKLRALWEASGLPLAKLFNTSGQSYRAGGWKDRLASATEDEALAALAADGKLIKRPIVEAPGGRVLVGFREADYAGAFPASS